MLFTMFAMMRKSALVRDAADDDEASGRMKEEAVLPLRHARPTPAATARPRWSRREVATCVNAGQQPSSAPAIAGKDDPWCPGAPSPRLAARRPADSEIFASCSHRQMQVKEAPALMLSLSRWRQLARCLRVTPAAKRSQRAPINR